jgi:IS5 family transposase
MQPSFNALMFRDKITRSQKFLSEMEKTLPWRKLLDLLKNWKTSEVGRKGYQGETMLRMWLLQNWYGLSDELTEEKIYDSFSFQQFMKLDLGCPIPDATTLCLFRQWLTDQSIQEKMLEAVNDFLEEKGLLVKKGALLDATVVEAAKSKKNKAKKYHDTDASSTKKGNRWYRGYKLHCNVSSGKIIAKAIITTASCHDSSQADDLLTGKEQAVFADKGYYSEERKSMLRKQKKFCGILDKAARGHPLKSSQKRRNRKLSSVRAFVEHPFNILKNRFNLKKTRYVGLKKNTAHLLGLCALHNLVVTRRLLLT